MGLTLIAQGCFEDPGFVSRVQVFLDGEFCNSTPDPDTCRGFIDALIQPAMDALGRHLEQDAQQTCSDALGKQC